MGFNTVLTFCNDSFSEYMRNPEKFFGVLYEGINHGARQWGITVHKSEHADTTQLIAAGGNFSTNVLNTYYVGSHHTEDGQVAILRDWADKLGYRIVAKGGK